MELVEDYSGSPDPPLKSLSQKGLIKHRWCSREYDKDFLWLCHPKKHHFVHAGRKPFWYSECGKSCSSEGSFKAHALAREAVWPFQCIQCDEVCCPTWDWQEHQVPHTGQHPLSCQQW